MTYTKLKLGSTIGIIGGGQLGKMMAQSAQARGFKVAVLDPMIHVLHATSVTTSSTHLITMHRRCLNSVSCQMSSHMNLRISAVRN